MLDSRAVNFSHSFPRMLLRACLLNIGFCAIIFGIFFHSQPSGERETLWIVDTSLSMAVEDVTHIQNLSSSRLDLAKAIIASGVVNIPGQHAIMTFSDIARLQVPLTSDRDFIGLTLRTLSPRLYGGGTDISPVLATVELLYPAKSLQIIILTDGEMSRKDISFSPIGSEKTITLIGIGTTGGGPILEGYDIDGHPMYKQFQGTNALSRLDQGVLQNMADNYDADLIITSHMEDISDILSHITPPPLRTTTTSRYLVLFGVCLIILSFFILPFRYGTRQ